MWAWGGGWGGGRRSLGEVIVRLCYCKHRLYASLDAPFLGLESIRGGRKRGVGGDEEADC